MTDKKYEIVNRETIFQGYYRVERLHIKQELFEGGWSDVFSREVMDRGRRCSCVLPFDPHQDKVVLVEQFRPGAVMRDEDPWMIEMVAGVSDVGESLEDTARREALEEAGCKITELQQIMGCFTSPGCTNEHATFFIGRTTAPENGSVCGLRTEHENIRVLVMPTAEAFKLLYAKKIRDAATIITLQWFALRHTELRSRWLASDTSALII